MEEKFKEADFKDLTIMDAAKRSRIVLEAAVGGSLKFAGIRLDFVEPEVGGMCTECLHAKGFDADDYDCDTEEVKRLLLEGAGTDGAHHKQWFIVEALRILCPELLDEVWDNGTPP